MINPNLIKEGQGPRVAFLEQPNAQLIAETLVALANTEGGTIVIGLKANGEPADTAPVSEAMQSAMKRADDLYNPPVVVDQWQEVQLILDEKQDSGLENGDNVNDESEEDSINSDVNVSSKETGFTVYTVRVPRSIELHALADGRV